MFYRIKRWMFRWAVDEEGDLCLEVCRFIKLVKYKDNTLIRLSTKRWPEAHRFGTRQIVAIEGNVITGPWGR